MAGTLSISVDVAEPRIHLDRQAVLIDGRDWALRYSAGVGVDKLTFTGMLLPVYYTAGWQTSGAGPYERFSLSSYALTTPAKWVQFPRRPFSEDYWLHSLNVNETVRTYESFPKNQPIVLCWVAYNIGNEEFVQIECGWGEGTSADVRLRFWSSGTVEVWRNGVRLQDASITKEDFYPTTLGPQGQDTGASSRMLAQDTVDVLLIPCRRRELLIQANTGGACNILFDDIDDNDDNPTIVGAGRFWWYVPSGQATVQCAKMHFSTIGYLLSGVRRLRFAPATGSSPTITTYFDPPGFGSGTAAAQLVEADGSTAFVANGVKDSCRVRLNMTGDGSSSYFVYGASATFDPVMQNTANSPTVLDDYLLTASLSVGDSPSDARMDLTLGAPVALEAFGASRISRVGNRSILVSIGSIAIINGRSGSPKWSESTSDLTRRLMLEVRDRWKVYENYRIKEPIPIGGMYLSDAIKHFAKMPGFLEADMDVPFIDFKLPTVGQESQGEWGLIPEVADTPADWLMKLWETFAKTYFMGWVPTATGPVFRFRSPVNMGITPAATLYGTEADAVSVGGYSEFNHRKHVFRSFDETTLECEANSIEVVGRRPRTGLPILARYVDTDSTNVTLSPAARPDNWLGEPREYGLVEPRVITTQAAANYALGILALRLTEARRPAEWECEFQFHADGSPVWRGDVVTLYGYGRYRVLTLSGDFEVEHEPASVYDFHDTIRPFRYTGIWVSN